MRHYASHFISYLASWTSLLWLPEKHLTSARMLKGRKKSFFNSSASAMDLKRLWLAPRWATFITMLNRQAQFKTGAFVASGQSWQSVPSTMPSAKGTCETIYCSFLLPYFPKFEIKFSPFTLCWRGICFHVRLRLALAAEGAHSTSFTSTWPMTCINIESGLLETCVCMHCRCNNEYNGIFGNNLHNDNDGLITALEQVSLYISLLQHQFRIIKLETINSFVSTAQPATHIQQHTVSLW